MLTTGGVPAYPPAFASLDAFLLADPAFGFHNIGKSVNILLYPSRFSADRSLTHVRVASPTSAAPSPLRPAPPPPPPQAAHQQPAPSPKRPDVTALRPPTSSAAPILINREGAALTRLLAGARAAGRAALDCEISEGPRLCLLQLAVPACVEGAEAEVFIVDLVAAGVAGAEALMKARRGSPLLLRQGCSAASVRIHSHAPCLIPFVTAGAAAAAGGRRRGQGHARPHL